MWDFVNYSLPVQPFLHPLTLDEKSAKLMVDNKYNEMLSFSFLAPYLNFASRLTWVGKSHHPLKNCL